MTGTGAANWTVPGGPHTAAASRPCGLRKACNPASTPGTSGQELQALAAQHRVEARLLQHQLLSVTLEELEVGEPLGSRPLAAHRQPAVLGLQHLDPGPPAWRGSPPFSPDARLVLGRVEDGGRRHRSSPRAWRVPG